MEHKQPTDADVLFTILDEQAARAESRLIEQLNALADRLDRIGTTELAQAQERLANSAAALADRLALARAFVEGTLSRAAVLMESLSDLFSDDATRADEVMPPVPTHIVEALPAEAEEAIALAPWHDDALVNEGRQAEATGRSTRPSEVIKRLRWNLDPGLCAEETRDTRNEPQPPPPPAPPAPRKRRGGRKS
jgi:ABC-type transporter Mla subunit MlaD